MKILVAVALIVAVGWWYASSRHPRTDPSIQPVEVFSPLNAPIGGSFKCDGRTYCSQMTSCAEATYFLKNCPGTKMDGNNDGVPCEKQWCN